ncbi:hypothetical protein [Lysinibacillus piscis]|uniref:Uncharacterized protein n=1 Tax=Lysinibacillus piscis TaxID=2518931 RepID=A0ABQ5NRA0_9BACI|nr:hypothetical protein [Lysinibacillus sp. KH24]GLC90544.1 hypothetical protein LYSBPC_36710 [Lysinibacillus sp. KH24]
MQSNIIFLFIGIVLSVTSKVVQFVFKSKIGDMIVIPAAIFFVLAVLFSIPQFKHLERMNRIVLAVFACMTVVSFQVMMLLLVGYHTKIGFLFLIPCIVSAMLVVYKWFKYFPK